MSDASSRLQRRPPQPRAEDLSDCRTSFAVAELGEGEPWEIAREAAEPEARVIPASLPHARVGALAGFLEIVAERGGRVDLHRVAGELHLDVRDLLPLVDAAVLLGWVQVQEGDAILSPEGRSFVEAPVLARKELFRTALQQRPTLVMRIHAALSGKANRRLSESFFRVSSRSTFSAAEARRQLDTAIDWGRYAEPSVSKTTPTSCSSSQSSETAPTPTDATAAAH